MPSDKHYRKLRLIIVNTCLRLKDAKPASDERPEQDDLEKHSCDLWRIHRDELEATLFLKGKQKLLKMKMS